MTPRISSIVLVVLTSLLLVLFWRVVSVFFLPLFLAAVTVLMLRPLHVRVTTLCGGRRYMAASLMTVATLLGVLIPFSVAFFVAGQEAVLIVDQLEAGTLRAKVDQVRSALGVDLPFASQCRFVEASLRQLRAEADRGALSLPNKQAIRNLQVEFEQLHLSAKSQPGRTAVLSPDAFRGSLDRAALANAGTFEYQQAIEQAVVDFRGWKTALVGGAWLLPLKELTNPAPEDLRRISSQVFAMTPGWVASLSGATGFVIGRTVFGLLIFVVALFFWFADGPHIVGTLMTLSPLDDDYERELMAEFEVLVRAVVAGSVVSAIVQAILSGLGFWAVGIQSIFLLMALTSVLAMVPFVGASLVWAPVCLWLIFGENRVVAGGLLAVYGLGVISTIDNLVRPWILLEKASLHPLAALLGVLGGVQGLGPAGVFAGPIVVAFVQTFLTLLHREFSEKKDRDLSAAEEPRQTDS